jgi:GlpG protein
MRQIGSLPRQDHAQVFGDYLVSIGIPNSVEQSNSAWDIWVEHDDHLDRARLELQQFLATPDDPKYRHASLQASAIRSRDQRHQKRLRQNFIDVRTSFSRAGQRLPPLTLILVILCLVVGALTWFGNDPRLLQYLWISSIPDPDTPWAGLIQFRHGQLWRLITPIFVHYGPMHLIFNLLWLLDLGAIIERKRGALFLAAVVLASAIPSNLAQYLATGSGFGGMSGVVYTLFGYVWMKSRLEPHEGLHIQDTTVLIMIAWLFICMTGWVGPIANTAHVVGLLVGLALGVARPTLRRLRRYTR